MSSRVRVDRIFGARSSDATASAPSSDRWGSLALVLAVCVVVAAVVYGAVAGLVYPEYSDFAPEFGGPSGRIGFSEVLGNYFHLTHGWYRPTSFYLFPWLLGLDYFEPGRQVLVNIAFMTLTAAALGLFVRRTPVLPALVAALTVLLAPTLYLTSYAVQIDSLYVLFAMLFIFAAARLFELEATGWRRRGFLVMAVASYILAITAKEIAVIAPFIAVPLVLITQPLPSWAAVRRVVRICWPFAAASLVFVGVYTVAGPESGGIYNTHPGIDRLPGTMDVLAWSAGFEWPSSQWLNWIPRWGGTAAVAAGLLIGLTLGGALLLWRSLRPWRIAIYVATTVVTAAAIASVGGLPHHSYPVVVLYGGAVLSVAAAAWRRACECGRRWARPALGVALGVIAIVQVTNGRERFEEALQQGPHTTFLNVSTELFRGDALAPLRNAPNPFLVFEDCLGGLHNPLKYYARSRSGSELVVNRWEPAAIRPHVEAARAEGRPVFLARCTYGDPFYRVTTLRGQLKG